ncbi:DUF6270 domain-containing protein [Achromobacter piechaudii]|uniref:DUF6270 domain-containing protein n=1 Tax=Achromobacter piechaudii TaxID=72556 RepID=UPI003DA7CFA4
MKVFILGSCVSRDALDLASKEEFTLVDYIARTSIGSVFAEPPFADHFSEKLSSPFQKRLVQLDIAKSTKSLLSLMETDVFLVDLIDERFDLLETAPGKFCTLTNEFAATGAPNEIPGHTVIPSGSDLFMQYWTDGWKALVALLSQQGMLHKVRVNAVQLQERTVTGALFRSASVDSIQASNVMLDKMYSRMSEDLQPHQFFRYGDEMACPDKHKWSPEPFHFTEELSLETLRKLKVAAAEISKLGL